MPDYLIRYRNLSGDSPMSPVSERLDAPNAQAAVEVLKQRHPDQELRIEAATTTTPPPKKRKTRAEWIVLALIVVIGGINLLSRSLP